MESKHLPYDRSSAFSKIFFLYLIPFISFYKTHIPSETNCPDYPQSFRFNEKFQRLKAAWEEEKTKQNPNFVRALWKATGVEYFVGSCMMSYGPINSIILSIVLDHIIEFMLDKEASWYTGAWLAAVFIALNFFRLLLAMNGALRVMIIVGQVKNWICIMIGEKTPQISMRALSKGNTSGTVINSVSSDIELFELLIMTAFLFTLPISLILAVSVLWLYLGYAGIVGIALIVLHLFILVRIGRANQKVRMTVGAITDSRVKMLANLLEGIKIVKLYAWEHPFIESITNERNKETVQYRKLGCLQVLMKVLYFGLSGISVFAPLVLYVYTGHELTTGKTFAAISILVVSNNIIVYITAIGLRSAFLFKASCNRISSVLLLEEVNLPACQPHASPKVSVRNGVFAWRNSSDSFKLKKLKLKATPGDLVLVSGSVGSGKSTLLMALMNELSFLRGTAKLRGTVAYAGENPWILSATVRDNIVMGQDFDQAQYNYSIHASALKQDLSQLYKGDESLVGDKGITLSGGQKARISLARALYANRQIILLDDPLSAVDTEVSSILFTAIRELRDKGKIVILATHQVQYLPYADTILLLDQGKQVFYGNYEEFCRRSDLVELVGRGTKQTQHIDDEVDKPKEGTQAKIEEEEQMTNMKCGALYWRYAKYGFKSIWIMILMILIVLISQAFVFAIYFWVGLWAEDSDSQEDLVYLYGFLIIIGMLYLTGALRFIGLYWGLIEGNRYIHNSSLKAVTETHPVFFDKNPSGRILNRFTKDTAVLDENLQHFLVESITSGALVLGGLLIILVSAPYVLAGAVPFGIFIVLCIRRIGPLTQKFKKLELISRSPLLTTLNSMVSGLVIIRNMGYIEKFRYDINASAQGNMKVFSAYHMILRFVQYLIEIGTFLITSLAVVTIVSLKDEMSPDLAGVILSIASTITGLTGFWAKNMLETDNFMASTQRMLEFCELEPEGEYTKDTRFSITAGKIEFNRVSLRYQPNLPIVLDEVSFTIEGGQHVGIIGRTGSGKSSIVQALFRLTVPESGKILIDGQNYILCGLRDLRLQMSVIPQTPFLFRASIRENLDPFHEHADAAIYDVLEKANLGSLIESLPEGIYTDVMSEQLTLSAGQKQLLCLARAIIRRSKIVVMDEATANVDHDTDRVILKGLKRYFAEATILTVAHRLRTIVQCDTLLVMQSGKCSEAGPPAVLAKQKKSRFRKLIESSEPHEQQYLLRKLE